MKQITLMINGKSRVIYEGTVVRYRFGEIKHMGNSGVVRYDEEYEQWLVGNVPLSNLLKANYIFNLTGE